MSSATGAWTADRYLAEGVETVDGWLSHQAIPILRAVEDEQRKAGVSGGAGEIGVHHGRLFILLALLARRDEGLVAVDLFARQDLNRDQSGRGDEPVFRANLERFLAHPERVRVIAADSTTLTADELLEAAGGPLRMMSLDGGHTEEVVRSDLELAARAAAPGAVVMLDDYFHPQFPGASVGGAAFLLDPRGPGLVPFATGGNKLWLTTSAEHAERYRRRIVEEPVGSLIGTRVHRMAGSPVVCVSFEEPPLEGVDWAQVEDVVARQSEALGVSPARFMAAAARSLPPEYLARLSAMRRRAAATAARTDMHVHYDAATYDRYTAASVAPFDRALITRVVAERERRGGGPGLLLDVGTGTARTLVAFARDPRLDPLRLEGIDLFEDMVARARETVAEEGLAGRIAVRTGDAHALPHADGTVDVVVSRSTLHHWRDPALALREMRRVLAPGGVAVVQDVRRDAEPDAIAAFDAARRRVGVPPSDLGEKLSAAEARRLLVEAGLDDAELVAPADGPGAIGFEITIRRPDGPRLRT